MPSSHSLQYKAHTLPTDQTPSYPYKLYQRIAGNKYKRTGAAAGNCMNYHVDMQMHLGTLFVFVRAKQIFLERNVNFC